MAADVHSISLVLNGAGDSADAVCGFENDGTNVAAAQKLERGGEPGRTGADDHSGLACGHRAGPARSGILVEAQSFRAHKKIGVLNAPSGTSRKYIYFHVGAFAGVWASWRGTLCEAQAVRTGSLSRVSSG